MRCFGKEQRLDLRRPDGGPAKWVVLLGDNGAGKTTLLEALFGVCPVFGPGYSDGVGMRLLLGRQEQQLCRDDRLKITATLSVGTKLTGGQGNEQLVGLEVEGRQGSSQHGLFGAFCLAYGAGRTSPSRELAVRKAAGLPMRFEEAPELRGLDQLFILADYASLSTGDSRNQLRERLRKAIVAVLPEEVTDIRVAGLDLPEPQPRVEVQTPFGWVDYHRTSFGQRVMATWVGDLITQLLAAYPTSDNPMDEAGIVLIDEIDLHLHPKWQREIVRHLDELFPNIQFIVTSHSPLVVQGESVTNVAVLRREGDQALIHNTQLGVQGWRVDQVLTSDLFGLERARSKQAEDRLLRREELLARDDLDPAERAELTELNKWVHGLPAGESAEDRETWSLMKRATQALERGDAGG